MTMRYLSVCSGIEAATVAWHPLGWKPVAFSEIEPFPRAVLAHHYPEVPLHGDFTTIKGDEYGAIDLLVGGTPCQSFSVAGLRGGLDDDRGNLALEFLRLAQRTRPRWVVWENVPGVLSSNGGRDFGSILGGLVECGYGFAYRVLDAQYFGVAQRRRRVFVVGCLGDAARAAAVLFERDCLSGNPAPRRETGKGVAPTVTSGASNGSAAHGARSGSAKENLIVPTFRWQNETTGIVEDDCAASLRAKGTTTDERSVGAYVKRRDAVRRLTPRECERLQGFPDDYTNIRWRGKETPDGPRYKALGNSMAVPCMAWIGQRIAAVAQTR